ncbi:MAG TPA: nucleotidyltransferase family protein, partial [Candidatus Acidoferrum sp.]
LCLEDEFTLNSIHGAKHFWERLMWVADIAAIVARHPEIDWQCTAQYANDVGAARMLHVALQLAESLLRVPIPAPMKGAVARDAAVPRLCRQVIRWLPSAGYAPPELRERAIFRMRMRGGILAGALYLLRLSFSPTEEDWAEGAEAKNSRLWDALQRPLRLFKKYGAKE